MWSGHAEVVKGDISGHFVRDACSEGANLFMDVGKECVG